MMLPRTHSKAYLEALFHTPHVSGTIGSRPIPMHRTASMKSSSGVTDNYKPTRSSILAAKEPFNEEGMDEPTDEDGLDDRPPSEPPMTPNKALSVSSTEDDIDDPSRHLRISTLQQLARRSSDGAGTLHVSQSIQAVLALLDNEELDDEERIEQVRSLLAVKLKELEGGEISAVRLDNIVLSLLHRHREDVKPTGATFPPPTSPSPSPFPASPRSRPRPANLRASSSTTLTRPWTPTRPTTPTNASHLSSDTVGSLPTSPLPTTLNNGGTAMLGSPRASPSLWHRTVSSNASSTPVGPSVASSGTVRPASNGSRPSSPAPGLSGSPALNVAALEFRPRAAKPLSLTPHTSTDTWLSEANEPHKHVASLADDSDEDEFSPFASQSSAPVPVPSSSSSSASSSRLTANRARPVSGTSGNSSVMSMTTADSVSGSYHGSTTSASLESSDDPRSLRFTGLEEDFENMTMTPFDVLTSILNGIGTGNGTASWSPEQIEEALERNNWDVDATLMSIMEEHAGAPHSPLPANRAIPTGPSAFRSGVNVVSQEIFATQRAGMSGSPGPTDATARQPFVRTQSSSALVPGQSMTPAAQQQPARTGPGRVCRFFLAGECRRADCRFSHDLNRALCRFWLKGQCLNGDDCSFLHDLSMVDSVANRVSSTGSPSPAFAPSEPETPPAEEFPELNLAPTAPKAQRGKAATDPSRARWAQTLQRKWNTPMAQVQQGESAVSLHGKYGPMRGVPTGPRAAQSPGPATAKRTVAARIPLRPPLLLPTLNTGRSAAQAYASYREACMSLSDKRNKCLARAAEAWKAGNGAEARKWSREGQSLNRILQEESRSLARSIVRSRHDEVRNRMVSETGQGVLDASTDERGARGLRGKVMGADLGICLGVVPMRAPTAPANLASLSLDERTDVLMDCHLLHASEAVEMVEEFLMGLEREQFRGLAYLAVGLGKHTSTETDRRRVGLMPAIKSFLSNWNYPFTEHDGVLVVDPLTHL